MSRLPPLSIPPGDDLILRLERAQEEFTLEWLRGVRAVSGNPRQLEIRRFGELTAPAAPAAADLDFMNRVGVVTPHDHGALPAVVAWYRSLGIRPWFEVAPLAGIEIVTDQLARLGARHEAFHGVVAAALDRRRRPGDDRGGGGDRPPSITVEEVDDQTIDVFSTTLLAGHEVPAAARPRAVDEHRHWATVPTWRLLLARVGGHPAGAAALSLHGDLALLANASTVAEFRGRGVQSALIDERIRLATAAGCLTVCSGVSWGSTSHRNLWRAGLSTAYSKAVWRLTAT